MWGDLYGFVYRNLRTHGVPHFDAEDLTQDILETAYIHMDSVEPGRRHAWLLTVARNKVVDRARRTGRIDSVAEMPDAADPGLGPDEIALQAADRAVLHSAMARLSERDRQLVTVRYLQERSIGETAEALGLSVGATKVALHRARERLRATLEATGTMGGAPMAGIADRAVRALSPYVGPTVAEMCVRGTAVSIGKTFDSLGFEDLAAVEDRARRVLAPLLPPDTIDRVVAEIRGGLL